MLRKAYKEHQLLGTSDWARREVCIHYPKGIVCVSVKWCFHSMRSLIPPLPWFFGKSFLKKKKKTYKCLHLSIISFQTLFFIKRQNLWSNLTGFHKVGVGKDVKQDIWWMWKMYYKNHCSDEASGLIEDLQLMTLKPIFLFLVLKSNPGTCMYVPRYFYFI